ncbi:MAG: multidrug effflux MFS transporter [Aestuariivita sp.]|nr:multidrug effflux MFS transporter [Aestuariivita sp.]MCY4201082.1 multidrug effflux MFS transporter [Aestuariivita sp.]
MSQISRVEFIALIAMLFATTAFSIDAMLPALPEIGTELSPGNVNRAQLILTSFVLGMGIGTFFVGPLSDTIGRKPVILIGALVYIFSSAAGYFAQSLELVLCCRILQGLGAAAPRVVSLAIVRDLYSGREMARIVSFAIMVFTIFPAFAPLIGSIIIAFFGWRSIFLTFTIFAFLSTSWLWFRQAETLKRSSRRPFRFDVLLHAVAEMFANRTVRLAIIVQSLCLGILFAMLSSVQPIYDITFNRAESFPLWFGIIALISGTGSLVNAQIVVRVGMRRIVVWSLGLQMLISAIMMLASISPLSPNHLFFLFLLWQIYVFFMAGTTMGNLNSIAMEPMGQIAGAAASTIAGVATVGAAAVAAPIGLLFDGSTLPLSGSIFCLALLGFALMTAMSAVER